MILRPKLASVSEVRALDAAQERTPSRRPPITVAEVMSAPVKTVPLKTSARAAAEMMRANDLLHLVVVDERGRVAGVLSDRDLRAAQPSMLLVRDPAMRENALSLLHVDEVMTKHPSVMTSDKPVTDAIQVMLHHKLGSVVVVDAQEHPIGIVTGVDVMKLTLRLAHER